MLLEPLRLGERTAPNRLLFGPHVTNVGQGRAVSARHVAYYERRAAGGCGVIVVEEASVDKSDWPYERSPLASECAAGWASTAVAVHAHGSLLLAALGHSGGQGSSAYSQRPLLAPSRVPEVNSREIPKCMEREDITAVVAGFGSATRTALEAGCDGVEINAGQHSLIRQFLSGLTNQRADAWGEDRLLFARSVLETVRAAAGTAIVGLRLSCDELAPWAGITPEQAIGIAAALAPFVDYIVVVRGSIFSVEQTRPDFHVPPGFNAGLCGAVRAAVPRDVAVLLQGSVVDVDDAEQALQDGLCDAVEMTRAHIADPDIVAKLRAGVPEQIRPCIRCNQTCRVRDVRNPIVTCVGEPTSGHETEDPVWDAAALRRQQVLVVGGGPAGLECARVARIRGHDVRLAERSDRLGGTAAIAGPGVPLVAWLEHECSRLGVDIGLGREATVDDCTEATVVCTGSRRGRREYTVDADAEALLHSARGRMAARAMTGDLFDRCGEGPVVIWDPIGGPIGVAVAETAAAAGRVVHLVTPDHVAGNELARTGDLAPANVRLLRAGVVIERRSILRAVHATGVEVEDRFSGVRRTIDAAVMIDAGHRLPDDSFAAAADEAGITILQAGDCVAPRTILEAVLEGRRAAVALDERQPPILLPSAPTTYHTPPKASPLVSPGAESPP